MARKPFNFEALASANVITGYGTEVPLSTVTTLVGVVNKLIQDGQLDALNNLATALPGTELEAFTVHCIGEVSKEALFGEGAPTITNAVEEVLSDFAIKVDYTNNIASFNPNPYLEQSIALIHEKGIGPLYSEDTANKGRIALQGITSEKAL